MHMKTLLLPTGEFALIVDKVSGGRETGEAILPGLKEFRERIGAAAVYVTDLEVTVEDAEVDEAAVRHDPAATILDAAEKLAEGFSIVDGKLYAKGFEPEDTPLQKAEELAGDTNVSYHFPNFVFDEFTNLKPGVIQLKGHAEPAWTDIGTLCVGELKEFFGPGVVEAEEQGREVSPAGIVKGQPGDPDFLHDPEFVQGGEPGADPEPEVHTAGGDWDSGPVDLTGFQVDTSAGVEQLKGIRAIIAGVAGSPEGDLLGEWFSPIDIVQAEGLEPEDIRPPRELQPGDTIRIKVDFSIWDTPDLMDKIGVILGRTTDPGRIWVRVSETGAHVELRRDDVELVEEAS